MLIYVVGGAVRDTLLNQPVNDIDYVVVGSTPEEMESLGYKQVGADFPVFLCPNGDEYALARTERKNGNGYNGFETNFNPTVTLAEDLLRRDLTINSMAVLLSDWDQFKTTHDVTKVIDPCGGLQDLVNKTLKHTSEHFADDPVRLLRIARFNAKYGFNVTRQTMQLMTTMTTNGEVDHLVPERVWAETAKAIELPNAMEFFWILHRCGALNVIIPGLTKTLVANGKSFRSATLRNCSTAIRMMILFGPMLDASDALTKLRAPSSVIRDVLAFQHAMQLVSNDVTPEAVLGFLKTIKTSELLYDISTAISVVNPSGALIYDRVIQGHNLIRFISFRSLPANHTLEGKQIGVAIDNLRIAVIADLL